MPEVLVPRFKFFSVLAGFLTEPDERAPKAVGIEIRQTGAGEGIAKNRADSRGVAPVSPIQPDCLELSRRPHGYARRREENATPRRTAVRY
jgi:hypothetical protein